MCECGIARSGAGSGDTNTQGRFVRVELRGLRRAAPEVGPPRAEEIGLQGVAEQTLSATAWRYHAGSRLEADATQ